MSFLVLAIGLVQAIVLGQLVRYNYLRAERGSAREVVVRQEELKKKSDIENALLSLYGQLIEFDELAAKVIELRKSQERLFFLNGQKNLGVAELEASESRLRELQEIDRELENSEVETKEQIRIATRKSADLEHKINAVKDQLSLYDENTKGGFSAPEQAASFGDQLRRLGAKGLEQCEKMLSQIGEMNDQYFKLKKRFDVLDIENALLFSKMDEERS